jgi:HTH-type transcriptional regulator/antitoxin HipB
MEKRELIQALSARREALGLSNAQVASRSGLTERSVRNALGALGNPQLSSLLALLDALELELNLAPKGFGARTDSDPNYRPVPTRIEAAIAQAPSAPPYRRGKT